MLKLGFHCALLILILGFLLHVSAGESQTCLSVYKEGGAPAVIESPECSLLNSSNFNFNYNNKLYDLRIPFPAGHGGVKFEVKVGIAAIFGHGGQEASEIASKLLIDYFLVHLNFLIDGTTKLIRQLPIKWEEKGFVLDPDRVTSSADIYRSFALEIMRGAMLKAIRDIDTTFSKAAYRYNLKSGTTATVVLTADSEILVANVGDSKALLCSEVKDSNGLKCLTVKELTRDRHPDRVDESYGVILVPEMTAWQPLTSTDNYMIAASYGVFDKLSPQDICERVTDPMSSCSKSLADCIVNAALVSGSTNNVAATVISLRDSGSNGPRKSGNKNSGIQEYVDSVLRSQPISEIGDELDELIFDEMCITRSGRLKNIPLCRVLHLAQMKYYKSDV